MDILILDQKRQHLFALAALIKSLADVPEQVKVVLRGGIYWIWLILCDYRYGMHLKIIDTFMQQGYTPLQREFTTQIWDSWMFRYVGKNQVV